MKKKLRQIPSVDVLLRHSALVTWLEDYPQDFIRRQINVTLDTLRQDLLAGVDREVDEESVVEQVADDLKATIHPSLRPVINGTGTVLHTNLGRALLAQSAHEAIDQVVSAYSNLEYDLEAGHRGTRYEHIEKILVELTGAEAALVVNNNAAAVMLMLATLTKGKEVLISRGELVEVGGSFRIPAVIESGGAILHEVGATNKTHIKDYQAGINEDTAALLRVHTSNYRLVGFTETPSDKEVVDLAHEHGILALNDLGSGLLIDLQRIGLSYEPTVKEMIDAGFDLVTFSGDKLLGGPQAGIIVGKAKYIEALKKNHMLRALRTDKITIAALEATFRLYLNPERAFQEIPTLCMIGTPNEVLKEKAADLASTLEALPLNVSVSEGYSQVGGGSYPGEYIPTWLVNIESDHCNAAQIEMGLRLSEHHIIARIHDEQVQFDVRTLEKGHYDTIRDTLAKIVKQ